MRLLLDEMWPPRVTEALRDRGHDAVAVLERQDLTGKPDAEAFETAQAERRAVVTEDPGFRRLAALPLERGNDHYGLIMTTNRKYPRSDPRTVGRLVTALAEVLAANPTDEGLRNREHWP